MKEPRSWTFTIPAPDIKPVRKKATGKMFKRKPWLNSNDRDHWRVTSPIRKEWRRLGKHHAELNNLPKGLEHVEIHMEVQYPTKRDYDAGNWYPTAKPIVDGFVDYGLTRDDNNSFVSGPYLHQGPKGPPAMIVTITEKEK